MKRTALLFLSAIFCALVFVGGPVRASDAVPIDEAHFPDPLFRQWLLNEANLNGVGADGLLTPEEIEGITEIHVPSMGLTSLKGIEVFPRLIRLVCRNNLLTELDMSGNPELISLLCDGNRLTELDLSHNPKLTTLNCELNYLTRLDLTGCTELDWLYCRHNKLEQLDLSTNTKLVFIETFDNKLTSIDISGLTSLEFLHIDHNRLTELDLSHNTALVNSGSGFVVRNNYIQKIILPDHKNLTVQMDVYAEQNPMEGYAKTEWYLDPEFTQQIQGDIQAKGQTLYAKWLPNPYTIYFDSNGGTGSVAPISTVYDASVVLPDSGLTRKGYTFQGWKGYVGGRYQLYAPGETVQNLTGKWDYQDSITLQAQWEPYQARLDANGGRFSDGQETMLVAATGGASAVRLPGSGELHRDGMELLAWSASPQAELSQTTPFYLPESEPVLARGSDLYAQWYDGGPLVIYHSPDGTVRLQSGTEPSLTLYGGETFLENGRPVRMWNTQPDGNGTDYLPGAGLDAAALEDGVLHLYPLWSYPTRTQLTLTENSYPYTGQPVALLAQATVTCGGLPVEDAPVTYRWYLASDPQTPLPEAPTKAGSYLVEAVFAGNPALEQLASSSQALPVTITQGRAELSFDGPQSFLWTGEAPSVRPPVLTLNGQPWQAEISWSYRTGDAGAWTDGLPKAPGDYQLRAELAATTDYTAASAETTLRIFCFQLTDGVVSGSAPVELPGGQGDCRIIAALYDRDSGQMLDVKVEIHSLSEGAVVLKDLRLDARDKDNLLVKIFVVGPSLEGLLPAPQLHSVTLP